MEASVRRYALLHSFYIRQARTSGYQGTGREHGMTAKEWQAAGFGGRGAVANPDCGGGSPILYHV